MRIVDIVFVIAGVGAVYGGFTLFANPPVGEVDAETSQPSLPLVETARVGVADDVASIRQTALLRPAAEVIVTAEGSGRVAEVNPEFELGGQLSEGDVIFRIETARLDTEVARAKADVTAAEAEVTRLAQDEARVSKLVDRNVSTTSTFDTVKANLAAAEARRDLAQAGLDAAQLALEDATVVAPFDAVVASEALSLGQFLQPGTEVGRLVSATAAELVVRLNTEQLKQVRNGEGLVGREVTVRATDGSDAEKTGTVERVALTAETATQTTGVLVSVADPFAMEGGVLRLNTLLEVEIPFAGEPERLLSVPVAAIQTGDRIWAVRDGVLRPAAAQIERRTGDFAIISSDDLTQGDVVLLTRLPDAVDGLRVRVAEDESDDGAYEQAAVSP